MTISSVEHQIIFSTFQHQKQMSIPQKTSTGDKKEKE